MSHPFCHDMTCKECAEKCWPGIIGHFYPAEHGTDRPRCVCGETHLEGGHFPIPRFPDPNAMNWDAVFPKKAP